MAFACGAAPLEGTAGVSGRPFCDPDWRAVVGARARISRRRTRSLRREFAQRLLLCAGGLAATHVVGGPGTEYADGAVVKVPVDCIRNFSIIAHIDHGKSTLADQLLLKTGTVSTREMQAQFLDTNDIERERGITIKLNTARMKYKAEDGKVYALNLIDTPGHVDFSYEVSRSLAACEGALLVVDAAQGVEAQTLANVYLALENDLEIIPVLNKIDLPGADPERVMKEIEDVIGLDASDALLVSAKAGIGIEALLEAIVKRLPAPKNRVSERLRALIYDSYYDDYRGVVCQFRVVDGEIKPKDSIQLMNTGRQYQIDEIGVLAPNQVKVDSLYAGEVGYLAASIKQVADARVGDTITLTKTRADEALPGYKEPQPMVYCGLFPTDSDQYQAMRTALGKLQLNDAALSYEPENSSAMGFGFRCGFLGLLHMEIVQERLEREYGIDLIITAPSVVYRCRVAGGEERIVSNPAELPEPVAREAILEPFCRMEMIVPKDFVGPVMELASDRRGEYQKMQYLTEDRVTLVYILPLAEVITDFFDQLKSRTRGYASMEYSLLDYRVGDLVKLEIKINQEVVEPLATIVHKDSAYEVGQALVTKLKEVIPRQQFRIPIQAAIGSRIISSQAISALRKDVLAKCYGGDISRKKKLLKKQAAGKKRMKTMGKVQVPQDAFMAILKVSKGGD
ncbi:unnamed protein product [Ostreobium quekettii]|uniref:Translation factor GUF1 homolog, chloroplastic n=1 Tax=Ostreobium quekettii TaxID=121088 RepID=A0A8S1IQ93_9CHLO|nr:unnamed protein product [Ostreobium quekettii]|eukprot:evm.model.scf_24.1 EVM.evm.TU.scf_24.1   scf_24:22388-29381(+)